MRPYRFLSSVFLSSVLAAWLIAGAALAPAALAQGFPSLTFEQLGEFNSRLIQLQKRPPRPGDLFFNPGETGSGKTRAVYTGESRPIDARKRAFIVTFASSSKGNERYAGLYQREYRFTSGGKDWWLPVQNQVAGYFPKELKGGDAVTLYIRNAGGFRDANAWQWVFLVEEFESAGPAAAPAKPAPGAPPPKAPAIPPGPKIET